MPSSVTAEVLESRQLLTANLVNAGSIGGANDDYLYDLDVDATGNRTVVGNFFRAIDADPGPGVTTLNPQGPSLNSYVSRIAADGNLVWAKIFSASNGGWIGRHVTTDGLGNTFVQGYFDGTSDFDPGVGVSNLDSVNGREFIVKLDSSGNFVWASQFGGGGASAIELRAMATDRNGATFLSGHVINVADFEPGPGITNLGTPNESRSVLLKFSNNGGLVWGRSFGGAAGYAIPRSLALAGDGNVLVGGSFFGTNIDFDPSPQRVLQKSPVGVLGRDDVFVSKFSPSGSLVWNRTFGTEETEFINGLTVDSRGNVVLGVSSPVALDVNPGADSRILTPLGINDVFVIELSSTGSFKWATQIGGDGGSIAVESILTDSNDQFIVAGTGPGLLSMRGETRSIDIDSSPGTFLTGLGRDGNPIWGNRISSALGPMDLAPRNDIVMAGSFTGSINIDPGANETVLTSAGQSDGFIAQFTTELRASAGISGTTSFLVRKNGDDVEITDKGTGIVLRSGPASEITGIEITGAAATKDSLLVDFGGGAFSLPQGIRFNASAGTDDLAVIGLGSESAVYRSGSFSGLTELLINGGVIQATGIESTDVSSMAAVRVETQGTADSVTVNPFQVIGTTLKTTVGGSSSGQTIVPLSFQAVDRVTVDTGAKDSVLAQSIDSVTISAGALEAPGLLDFIVSTGIANDLITITGPDFAAPGESGFLQVVGGTGVDRVNVTGDVNWTLSPTQVSNSLGSRLLFGSVETVGITAGAAANLIDASSFTGTAILDAGAGDDVVRGGLGNDTLFGGTGNDQIYGNAGNDTIFGQDGHDSIWGGDGNDVLYGNAMNDRIYGGAGNDWIDASTGNDIVLGDDGNDTILGGDGNDFLRGGDGDDSLNGGGGNDVLVGEDGDDILLGGTGNDRLNGGAGDDALTGEAGIDVYIFDGTSAADEMRLTRNSATTATYIRRPRGLLSILEQDSVTTDATDEFSLNALGGDDLIAIDLTFTLLGSIDGGDGIDSCTSPAAWIKISC